MSPLPPPRRVVSSHDTTTPSATPIVLDDEIPLQPTDFGQDFAMAYCQREFPGRIEDAVDGTTRQPDTMWVQSTGLGTAFLEFPPRAESAKHFTTTIDYVVVTHGQVDFVLLDGTAKTLKQGDLLVNVGSVHTWKNTTDEPCRCVAIACPIQPFKCGGKGLDEEPTKAYKVL